MLEDSGKQYILFFFDSKHSREGDSAECVLVSDKVVQKNFTLTVRSEVACPAFKDARMISSRQFHQVILLMLLIGISACHRTAVKPVHQMTALQAQESAIAARDRALRYKEDVIAQRNRMREMIEELEQVVELSDRRLSLCEREVKEQGVLVPPRPMLPEERYRPITPAMDK